MKFSGLNLCWTAGEHLAVPDTLYRNTPTEPLTRKTTVRKPQNITKFFTLMTKLHND